MPQPPSPRDFDLQSPPWNEPLWASRLQNDVPRLAMHAGCAPPPGVTWEDYFQELRVTLILRSLSPKSRWNPARGKSWAGWACMVASGFSINYHKKHKIRRAWTANAQPLTDYERSLEGGQLAPIRANLSQEVIELVGPIASPKERTPEQIAKDAARGRAIAAAFARKREAKQAALAAKV